MPPCLEELRLGIVFVDEVIDIGFQVDDRDERAELQSPFGEFGKKLTTALSHAHNSVGAFARTRQKHDPAPPDMLPRSVAITNHHFKTKLVRQG